MKDTATGTPLIGRDAEITELAAALDGLMNGRGRLFLISGEPGIGKSRLVDELAGRARERNITVLTGRCWEAGGAPPYWPWVQAIRGYIQDLSAEDLRAQAASSGTALAQLIPEIRDRLPDLPAPAPDANPESARFQLFDSVVRFLANVARGRPVLLVLEDLHVADEPSLLMLRFLSSAISDLPVLFVGTFRDSQLEREQMLLLSEVERQSVGGKISLTGLSEQDIAGFVKATAGVVAPAGLTPFLHAETEGNPLFVGEIVRLLTLEGRLERPPDSVSWRLTIPAGVREVILKRLSHLSDSGRSLLPLACVIGREFDISILQRLARVPRRGILDVIDEAVSAGVVTEVPAALGRFRFSHALVREALYEQLSVGDRIRLHERVGLTIEEMYADDLEPHLAELAHHFFQAAPGGDVGRGIEHARAAAAHAAAVLGYEEAVRFYAMALRLSEMSEQRSELLRCELLLGMGDSQARAGDAERAKESFLEAADIARRIVAPEHLARAALGYGGRFVWEAARGDVHLRPLLEEALSAFGDEESDLRIRVMARLAGGPLRDTPDRKKRDELSRRAVDMARRLGQPLTLAYALDGRYAAVWWPENLEERLVAATELISAARQAGDKERELQGHHYLFLGRLEQGDRAGADDELRAQVELARELRQPSQFFYVSTVQAMMATFEGRYDESEELIPKAFDLGSRAERSMAEIYRALQLYALRKDQGRIAEVEGRLGEAARSFPTYFALQCTLSDALLRLGREGEAREVFDSMAADGFRGLARNDEWLFALCPLAEVAVGMRDQERAATLYELLIPYSTRIAVSPPDVCVGTVSLFLGKLATLLERFDHAERHLEHAVDVNLRMAGRPWVARSEHAFAQLLILRDDSDDKERARGLVESALQRCDEIGMSGLREEMSGLVRELGIAPQVARTVRTFLFTDIVRSTDLVAAIGDDAWVDVVRWHDQALRDLFASHSGHEVDHAGDGFFVAFDDPASAVDCAVAIQRRLREHRREHGFAPQVRIGLHQAAAISSEGAYRGRGVHEAARIASLAGGDEILMSRDTILDAPLGHRLSESREVVLKGVGKVEVVAVEWN